MFALMFITDGIVAISLLFLLQHHDKVPVARFYPIQEVLY